MALLDIDKLCVTLPTKQGDAPILENIDLQLEAGGSLGLVGESGCGKSMTALAIMGLLPKAARISGRIHFAGQDLVNLSEREYCQLRGRQIAMVFQEPMTALNPVKTIGQQIAEGIDLHLRTSRAETRERVRYLLDRVGLPAPRFSPQLYPHQLSGGQRQRVVLAIALACGPQLLIADEPTTALDVTIQSQILDLIVEIVEQEDMGLLLITHDLGVVAETVEQVAVMYAGRVVEQGASENLFGHMAHPYTYGLFQAMPQAVADIDLRQTDKTRRQRLTTIPGVVPDPLERPSGCVFADRCPHVRADCRTVEPRLRAVDSKHQVACYYPLQEMVLANGKS